MNESRQEMQCSLVIRAYNEARHLGQLLEGIAKQTVRDVEVILVDSGSADSTAAIAERFGARILHIPAAEFSFGRSLNMGVAAATRDIVAIASAHVRPVYPDWLECLLRPFADDRVALVYGKQRGTRASRFSEHQIFRQWFPDIDNQDQENPFCNNANAAIRRELWLRQGYDESLTGLEDVGWAKWARSQGYRIVYSAHAEILHVHDETPARVYARYRREGMAFKQIFPEAHFSVYDFIRLSASNIVTDLRDALRQRVLWHAAISVVWFRIMQFWGTYQGYRRSGPLTQQLRQTFYYPPGNPDSGTPRRAVEPIRYTDAK